MEIRLDYEMAIKCAEKIKGLSDEVSDITAEIRGIAEDTGDYWQGEAGEAYREVCTETQEFFKKLSVKLNSLGEEIRKEAETLKAADEELSAAAESL
ncbi:MAG: WXG100 family type VII secretion target [Clostridiales bacterium]|nr:WXG100 family type VII secretion target [Clostridiales bacterium]